MPDASLQATRAKVALRLAPDRLGLPLCRDRPNSISEKAALSSRMRACLPRACDVAAGLRCFGNFLDPRRAATPAGVVLVAKLSEAPTNSGWPPRLARLSGSIPFCLSILSYTLGFMSSNSSARRPIGRGFALFCLADGPNEIAGATR